MRLFSLLLISGLFVFIRCIAVPTSQDQSIIPHPTSQAQSITPYIITETTSNYSSNLIPRRQKPYLSTKEYFGWELPENQSEWVAIGWNRPTGHLVHAEHYESIDPDSGEWRKKICLCMVQGFQGFFVPEKAFVPGECECCRASLFIYFTIYCRTYRLKSTD